MQNSVSALHFLDDPLRQPLERCVSEHRGREWKIVDVKDLRDLACHPAAILSDDSYSVFVKFSQALNGLEQFSIELAGLHLLAERAGVLTPTSIGIIEVEGGTLMVLEAAQAVARQSRHWREIGTALARIHKVKGNMFGLETQGYFGPLYQDNRPMKTWSTFFAERRLWPRLVGAVDSGNLPPPLIRRIEKLILRLPDLCGPESIPSLLHGDAQQNNFISTQAGAMVIDPAVCYGNPEFDLAYVDYFQPVPEEVFIAYQEELTIDPGFIDRRDLWRIYGYLAAVTVEGSSYLGMLANAVKKYE